MVKLQTELVETKPEWIEMYQIKFQFATRATLVSSSEIEERWVEGDWPAFDSMFRIAWATTSPFYRDRFSSWGKTTKPFSLSYPEWDEMYLSWGWAYLRPSSGRPQEGRWKYNVSFVVIFLKIITKLSNEINSHLHDMIWLKLRTKFKYQFSFSWEPGSYSFSFEGVSTMFSYELFFCSSFRASFYSSFGVSTFSLTFSGIWAVFYCYKSWFF